MKTQVEERFSEFFEEWVCQLEVDLQLLLRVPRESSKESDYETLVAKLTAHHKTYYTAKWAAAHEDVLAFFVPGWLSPLENVYLWVTGWKPSVAFRLVESLRRTGHPGGSLAGMTEDQLRRVEELRVKIRLEEEKVEREMERQQVGMADRRIVELARLARRVSGGEAAAEVVAEVDGLVEAAMKSLLSGLERVMKMADCVRLKTLKGVLDVLSPIQCVDFFAANSMVQIQLRKWGKKREKDGERERESSRCLEGGDQSCTTVQFV